MNARDQEIAILSVENDAIEAAALPDVWKGDFSTVPQVARRAARYALQYMFNHPEFHALEDFDPVVSAWKLVAPLINLTVANATFNTITAAEDNPRKRLLLWQKRLLRELPSGLMERLARDDGDKPTQRCSEILADTLGLNCTETRILDYLSIRLLSNEFREFTRATVATGAPENRKRLASMLGTTEPEVRMALLQRSALRGAQLLEPRQRHHCDLEDFIDFSTGLSDIFLSAPETVPELTDLLMESSPPPEWAITDYPHLASAASRLANVLSRAAKNDVIGINALLFGPPGTGKTEFARALAHAAGLTLYQVRNADEDGDGMGRDGRITAYMIAQRLLRNRRDAVILFDEIEDVFADDEGAMMRMLVGAEQTGGKEKGFMNRLLETNPVPAIWVTNNVRVMDAAFLRRFLLPVEFSIPPRTVRRNMVERHLGGGDISEKLLDELAADDKLAPAQFGDARRLLALHDDLDDVQTKERIVREGVASIRRLLHGSGLPSQRRSATIFDIAFLNIAGGIAPQKIATALDRTGRGSLCFYGPPGTGKTEFAQILANALGRELVTKQTSDLVSAYVGETEQNIARLFNSIDPERTVLFIDEVDSFLKDRRQAQRSWEVTTVNELLQHMERFPGIFIAATNLFSSIDQAALRRFDFKLMFRPLSLAQRVSMFQREALGDSDGTVALLPTFINRLEQLEQLTPGDFANVCRQRDLLAEELTPEDFLRRLTQECRWKEAA